MRIELIYDRDCPHVDATREHLRQACRQTGVKPQWHEWDRADTSAPPYVRTHGSPTVLIDGQDVGELEAGPGNCCRIYKYEGQMHGVPPVGMIAARLDGIGPTGGAMSSLATIPAAAVAAMPALACPACWPAYASLLGSLGLGFMIDTAYLMPITVVALLMAVSMLGVKARRRHGFGPLVLGSIAALIIVLAKFAAGLDLLTYGGGALLIAASVWNAWPMKPDHQACPSCEGACGKEVSR